MVMRGRQSLTEVFCPISVTPSWADQCSRVWNSQAACVGVSMELVLLAVGVAVCSSREQFCGSLPARSVIQVCQFAKTQKQSNHLSANLPPLSAHRASRPLSSPQYQNYFCRFRVITIAHHARDSSLHIVPISKRLFRQLQIVHRTSHVLQSNS